MNKEKIKYWKVLLLIFDLILVIGLVVLYFRSKNVTSYDSKEEVINSKFQYKNFIFDLPNGTSMKESTNLEYKAEVTNKDYYAVIEIYYDDNKHIQNNLDLFKNEIINYGVNVSQPEIVNIGDKDIMVYRFEDNSDSVMFLYKAEEPYLFFVQFFGYNEVNVESLLNILSTAKIDYTEYFPYRYIDFTDEIAKKNSSE